MAIEKEPLNIAQMRASLAGKKGQQYWRSLDQLAETEEFLAYLRTEFPQGAAVLAEKFDRRKFLRLMGASMALAGLTACSPPGQLPEKIVPYVEMPEGVIPGEPLFFATAFPLGGYAIGALAESHEGRPTKIEGNPDHPDSLGASNIFAQASVLTLYDPDRAQTIAKQNFFGPVAEKADGSWDTFKTEMKALLETQQAQDGAGIRILTQTVTSPTLAGQINAFLKQYPAAKWHQYQPVNRDNVWMGAQMAFGKIVSPRYHFNRADVVLSLDADFFAPAPGNLRYARDFMQRRQVGESSTEMNRLYAVESTPTLVGALADNRLSLKATQVELFARALAKELGVRGVLRDDPVAIPQKWVATVANDLQAHKGSGLIIAGEHQPPVVHALAHLLNEQLGNAGNTVVYAAPAEANPVNQAKSLATLTADMALEKVDLLIILDGNPVFDAPADLDFVDQLRKVKTRVYHGLYQNETAQWANWFIPATHYLESWADARAFDGTVSVVQPLIAPLYADSKAVCEVMDVLLGQDGHPNCDIVRDYWAGQFDVASFDTFWQTTLHDGVMVNTAFTPQTVSVHLDVAQLPPPPVVDTTAIELNFRPDPTIWDGKWANNGWLQELPKPLTKLTWDNAALLSPSTAEQLAVTNNDLVTLIYQGRKVEVPVWIMPGHADNAVTVHLGYGRTHAGQVGSGVGFNVYPLRLLDTPWFADGVQVEKTGQQYALASTQDHSSMEGRDLVRVGTLATYLENPEFAHEADGEDQAISLYPPVSYAGRNAWGMTINLSTCIGCNACVVACQSENNIPIVGKEQVSIGREMHWIRLDRYYEGDLDQPETHFQPVNCMQCENAPCEPVCPVEATLHGYEGLNDMIYNRCVGTRYCSNNCPYKVRRFNFLQYNNFEEDTPLLEMAKNPDVTVRSRGVMEKCTYCVQRINTARIQAKKENRDIQEGEIITACQAVCPTQAIIFGDINDPNSTVARQKASPLNYTLLDELNTRPRTSYLAKLKNPNPELEGAV